MISQFVLLPACAYFLIVVFQIDPLHATGLLILACSPGGVTSNVFAYFCEGDLSLRYDHHLFVYRHSIIMNDDHII